MAQQTEGDEPVFEEIELVLVLRDVELPELVTLEVVLPGVVAHDWRRWTLLRAGPGRTGGSGRGRRRGRR
ncbi:MAG TPA: hypothetical protein VGL20_18855 [Candidatus Dormibacteraeota bacterium]|jgi:hypothetical protein